MFLCCCCCCVASVVSVSVGFFTLAVTAVVDVPFNAVVVPLLLLLCLLLLFC